MAITGRLVDDKATTTGATSYASDVPAAGSVTETHIVWVINSHATDATLPTLSGGGLTWTQIETAVFGGHRCTAFRARGTNTAAAVTASMGGTTQTGCIIIWGAWVGVDGTTNEGVVQFKSAALGGDNPGFATLDNAVGVGNAVASGACSGDNNAHSAESGFAELSDVGYATPATRGHMIWAVTSDTSPAHTATGSTFWRIVAVELKAVSQTVAIGQVTETDTPSAITWAPKIRALGQVSSTNTAQALTRRKTQTIGQVSEADTAQPIAAPEFPVVAARNNSVESSAVTSHDVSLPAGITAGDLLIVQIDIGTSTVLTWPAGWTLLSAGGSTLSELRYRFADGTEGATIVVTSSNSRMTAHRSWRITNQHASAAPEAALGSGFSATPEPPNLAPSWGAADTLWLATCGVQGNMGTPSVFPTDYDNTFSQASGVTANDVGQATAERRLNVASTDPSAFTVSASHTWRAWTIAIRPVAAAGVITIGQTSETDTPSTLGRVKTQDIAAAEETDTVSALGRKKSVALGQVSEADTAQLVPWNPKIRLLGQALETDTAQVITSLGAISQVVETDTAQAFTHHKTRQLGQEVEQATAQAIGKRKAKATGQVSEADTAMALIALLQETWRIIRPRPEGALTGADTGTLTPPAGSTLTRP